MKPVESPKPVAPGLLYRLKNTNIGQAWLVLVLALCFGASLAAVQLTLGPVIEQNKLNETLQKVPELVLGTAGAQKIVEQNQNLVVEPEIIAVEKGGRKIFYSVYKATLNGEPTGWVVKTAGQGYADKIEVLIGFDPAIETITGLFVLDQKETPGLGNKIITEKWRKQFAKKDIIQPLVVVKKGAKASNEVDSVTGATISSESITSIINKAASDLRGPLSANILKVK